MFCFIHSPIDGYLDYFHPSAILNNATMNVDIQISLQVSDLNSFGYIRRGGIPGPYGNCMSNFLSNYHCCIAIVTFFLPIKSIQGSNYSTSLSAFVVSGLLKNSSHSNGCDTASHSRFYLQFSWWSVSLSIFFCTFWLCVFSEEMVFSKSFAHFWTELCICCLIVGVPSQFWVSIPYQMYDLQIFFHSEGCLFILLILLILSFNFGSPAYLFFPSCCCLSCWHYVWGSPSKCSVLEGYCVVISHRTSVHNCSGYFPMSTRWNRRCKKENGGYLCHSC